MADKIATVQLLIELKRRYDDDAKIKQQLEEHKKRLEKEVLQLRQQLESETKLRVQLQQELQEARQRGSGGVPHVLPRAGLPSSGAAGGGAAVQQAAQFVNKVGQVFQTKIDSAARKIAGFPTGPGMAGSTFPPNAGYSMAPGQTTQDSFFLASPEPTFKSPESNLPSMQPMQPMPVMLPSRPTESRPLPTLPAQDLMSMESDQPLSPAMAMTPIPSSSSPPPAPIPSSSPGPFFDFDAPLPTTSTDQPIQPTVVQGSIAQMDLLWNEPPPSMEGGPKPESMSAGPEPEDLLG